VASSQPKNPEGLPQEKKVTKPAEGSERSKGGGEKKQKVGGKSAENSGNETDQMESEGEVVEKSKKVKASGGGGGGGGGSKETINMKKATAAPNQENANADATVQLSKGFKWQPEVAVNYSCLFFLSIYNLFIIKNYLKKKLNI
jgi:hypothetical protein